MQDMSSFKTSSKAGSIAAPAAAATKVTVASKLKPLASRGSKPAEKLDVRKARSQVAMVRPAALTRLPNPILGGSKEENWEEF